MPTPERSAPMLKALLWDVDGTIAETERDGHRAAFNRAFAELKLNWGWCERRYGELLHITGGRERLLADMADRPDAPADPVEREALAQRVHTLKNHWYAWLVQQGHVQARPGVLGLMRDAHQAGLRQAIVTTTSRTNVRCLLTRLLGSDWASMFEQVVCGEDVARKKPDPEAYRLALNAMALAPAEVLAVEDSGPGVRASAAAAVPVMVWPSAYFPDTAVPAGARGWVHADARMPTLPALRERHQALLQPMAPRAA